MALKRKISDCTISKKSLVNSILPISVARAVPYNITGYNTCIPTTTNPKFGTKSIEFNQTNQYFRIEPFTNTGMNNSDFTVESWVWFNVMPRTITNGGGSYATFFFGQSTSGSTSAGIEPYILLTTSSDAASVPMMQIGTQAVPGGGAGVYFNYFDYSGPLTINEWHHFAICRRSGYWSAYWDGKLMTRTGQVPPTTSPLIRQYGTFGYWPSTGRGPMNGYFDEIRVSNKCRYSGPFSVPTEPFVNDDSTMLLIHANGNTITDDLN
jgi:hypothetical protein